MSNSQRESSVQGSRISRIVKSPFTYFVAIPVALAVGVRVAADYGNPTALRFVCIHNAYFQPNDPDKVLNSPTCRKVFKGRAPTNELQPS
jgi:hypothetical protein